MVSLITNIYQKAREKNILSGLLIIDLITFISYLIFPAGIFYFGDIQMIIGCIIGIVFTLKNIKSNQSYLLIGILTALGGTILSAISCSIFDWIILSAIEGLNLSFFPIIFAFFLIEAVIIGILVGGLISSYFFFKNRTHMKMSIKENEFYESLIDE